MKNIIIILIVFIAAGIMYSCSDMDVYPADQISSESVGDTEDGLVNVTNGNYALFKEGFTFQGFVDDNNCYLRQYYQMSDFSADDIVCGQKTEDPLYYSFTYTHSPDQSNSKFFWYASYKIISGANTAIQILEKQDELDEMGEQLLGENYFIRAFANFNLVRFYARPYATGNPESDLGIILRMSTSEAGDKARATVAESYEAVIADLEKAVQYMSVDRTKEFASKEAAQALLSRVYINMDDYENTVTNATAVIESNKYALETANTFPSYFANAISGSETIWCIAFTDGDNRGKFGSIASMIYSDGNSGWGEEFASPSYQELIAQNADDIRQSFVVDGEVEKKNGILVKYITKYSFQGGDPNLSSPVVFRLAEMYLNRAEAYAKQGNETAALNDVNTIRAQRGLQDNLITSVPSGMTILDVVLNEKRVELAFEGHRFFDVFRNKQDMNRNYWGYHIKGLTVGDIDLEVTPPSDIDNLVINWNDDAKLYFIPIDEINTNKLCIQN